MCGFAQLTFVTTPDILKGFFTSNSAENEWWAASGAMPANTRKTRNRGTLVVIEHPPQQSPRTRWLVPGAAEGVGDAVFHRFPMGFAEHLNKACIRQQPERDFRRPRLRERLRIVNRRRNFQSPV